MCMSNFCAYWILDIGYEDICAVLCWKKDAVTSFIVEVIPCPIDICTGVSVACLNSYDVSLCLFFAFFPLAFLGRCLGLPHGGC